MKKIEAIPGWILVTRDRETPPFLPDGWSDWRIAWLEIFDSRADAIGFAKNNGWMPPYRAVRGQLSAR